MSGFKNGLLWRLTDVSGNTGYIFGTMHVRDDKAFIWEHQLKALLLDCSAFYAELDLSENVDVLPQLKMSEQRLSSLWSANKWIRARRQAQKEFGIDLAHFNEFYPFFTLQQLSSSFFRESKPEILDAWLHTIAREHGLHIGGLEKWDDQINFVKSIPVKVQLKSLSEMIFHKSRYKRQLNTLVNAYLREDIHSLYQLSRKSLAGLRKQMLFTRNRYMANRILSILGNGDTPFFAVGAAHLGGSKGILRNLKINHVNCSRTRILL